MKANELMIGDWVKISHLNKIGKVYRIDRANGEGNGFAAVIDGDYYEGNLEPIPLTSEILEKNGFVNDRGIYCWRDENKQITYFSKENNRPYCTYSFVNIESGCIVVNELPIEYVHELQHTLRLCGIKIEIEL